MKASMSELFERYPILRSCQHDLENGCKLIINALEDGNTLFLCGNGGSAADSEHIAGELLKSFLYPRPLPDELRTRLATSCGNDGEYLAAHLQQGLRVVALTGHCALSTAMANDVAADLIFAQQVMALGREGDILLGISTSGTSVNVCHAVRLAREMGLRTVGLSGKSGGMLTKLCEITIRVPEDETYKIQELHLPVYHCICAELERFFFDKR